MAVEQPPMVLSLIVADNIRYDYDTGKLSLEGVHQSFAGWDFPLTYPPMLVYVELTDGRPGDTHLELKLFAAIEQEDGEDELLLTLPMTVNFDDPLEVKEVVFLTDPVVLPHPGEYRLQLWGENQFLFERRLRVIQVEDTNDS